MTSATAFPTYFSCRYFLSHLMCRGHLISFWISLRTVPRVALFSIGPREEENSGALGHYLGTPSLPIL